MYQNQDYKAVEQPLKGAGHQTRGNTVQTSRVRVKESRGWFPAGDCVRRARSALSDGAFKLYISISLDADASTGRYEATHQQLATLLGKSKRIIGVYVREIEAQGVCRVQPARNQHARTLFEVCDEYWPYHRIGDGGSGYAREACQQSGETDDSYVARIREYFLGLGCVNGSFSSADERFARDLNRRGVPVEMVEDAMLMSAIRKYNSWLTKGASAPIGTLRYVESFIREIDQQPWPTGYREYLEMKLRQFTRLWEESANVG